MFHFYFLHGFLGQGSNFDPLVKKLKTEFPESRFYQPDLLSEQSQQKLSPETPLSHWGQKFNEWVKAQPDSLTDSKRILVGYSMGGRLALHALINAPDLWSGAVILSANPGKFNNDEEVRKRKVWDREWADKFEGGDWSSLVNEWNELSVFKGSSSPKGLQESSFSREYLSMAMTQWSPTEHSFNLENVKVLPVPILWLVGERDEKYLKLYRSLQVNKVISCYKEVPQSGHRLLVGHHSELEEQVLQFLHQFV